MKPKPFSALNHFTVPCATCAPTFRAADGPTAAEGPGYSLFRPYNTNVELEPRRTVQHRVRGGSTSTHDSSPVPVSWRFIRARRPHPTPREGPSRDETRLPGRPQRRLHPVRGTDHGLQRVEGLQALPGVEDDGLLGRVEPPVLDQLPEDGDGHAARRLAEHAGRTGQVP